MMKAIYASKFYKSSKRQDSIRSAIADPLNKELVQQLREYIDDEWIKVTDQEPTEVEDVPKSSASSEESDNTTDVEVNVNTSPSPRGSVPKADHHLSDMLKEDEPDIADDSEQHPVDVSKDSDYVQESGSESESVEESTEVNGTKITSSVDLSAQMDSIAGILNASEDTTGVRRCVLKHDDELWIYYNDSINLNNVMEPVISLLNASNYAYLDFNRLARTDNAIVFSITETPNSVETIISE